MSDIRDTASLHLKVNGKEANQEFEKVKATVIELKKQLIEASNAGDFKKVDELHKKLKPAVKEMDSMLTNIGRIDAAMKNLSLQTPRELRRTMALINSEMNSGKIEVGSKQWKEYEEQLKKVKARLKELGDVQKVVTKSGLSFKDMLDIGGNLSMIAASVRQVKDSVAEFIRDNVNSYIELDAEMANVQKFTGMTRQSVEELNEEFKKIDTRTSVVELNKLAEEAGRLGKTSQEDILGFVKAADIINVALDDLGEGATLEISKLTNIFGDEKALGTERSMLAVGSVINELSQNCTAAAPYLANFTKRLAGVGAQADMTIPQIMGFAAVLDSQGQAVEMSATAVSQLITKMFQDPAKIAKAVGMDVKEFTDMVKTDTNGALLTLLERLNAFGNMDVLAPIFKEMGTDGARASAVLASLAGNVDMVRQQQELATEAYNEATSVVKEFSVQNETEEAKLEKKRKKLEEVKVALGEKLLPVMGAFTSTGTMMIKTLNALLDVFNEYKVTIISTGSAVLVYTGYVKAKNFLTEKEITLEKAKIFIKEKSLTLLKKIGNFMKTNPWGIAIVAITTLIGLLIDYNRSLSKVSAGEQALNDIRDGAKKKMAEEESRLKALIKVAEDETASLVDRKNAVNALNQIIPNYNAQLDETTGHYKANTVALDRYIEALKKKYELEGAKDMLAELGRERVRLYTEREAAQIELDNAVALSQAGNYVGGREGRMMNTGTGANIASKKQALQEINDQLDAIEKKEQFIFDTYSGDLSNSYAEDVKKNGGGGVGGGARGSDEKESERKKRLKREIALAEQAAKEKWDAQRAIEDAAYSRGEITYQVHVQRLQSAEKQYLTDCKAAYEQRNMTEENGYLQLLDKEKQLLERHNNQLRNMTLDDLERQRVQEQNEVLNNLYDVNSILFGNEKACNQKLFEINQDYLKKKAALYRKAAMSKEAYKIEQQIAQNEADEMLRKQKEYALRLQRWREEFSSTSREAQKQAELIVLDEMYKAALVKEEEYQQLRQAIIKKYSNNDERKFSDGGYGDMLSELYSSWDILINGTTDSSVTSMQKIGAVAQSTWAMVGAALEQYTQYSQACCDLETAEIEKKYNKEIAAAGRNKKRVAELEEQKEKDIAKVKSKYLKRAQAIEIAGAVAQTAIAAINAFSSAAAVPMIGYILAPIAAAMALAAGALQIATIQKQHQAQQAGYFNGGFTKRSANDHEVVGVVHANEYVVNAATTKRILPFLSLLDKAQQNNTVPSITADDVSHAMGTGAVVKATATTANESVQNSGELLAVAASIGTSAAAIERLNSKLDDGIESYMVMDGERGFDKKYKEYNQLKNNSR